MRRFHYTDLSLIELMISLGIGSFIILSSIYLLQHTIKSYHRQQQQIRQLENIRYLDYILNRAIHVAGFMGCHALQNTNIHNQLKNNQLLSPYSLSSQKIPTAIMAYRVTHSHNVPPFIHQHAKLNSDVLLVNHLSVKTMILQKNMDNIDTNLQLRNTKVDPYV